MIGGMRTERELGKIGIVVSLVVTVPVILLVQWKPSNPPGQNILAPICALLPIIITLVKAYGPQRNVILKHFFIISPILGYVLILVLISGLLPIGTLDVLAYFLLIASFLVSARIHFSG